MTIDQVTSDQMTCEDDCHMLPVDPEQTGRAAAVAPVAPVPPLVRA